EPDLVHAVVEGNDAVRRDDLADVVHDALRRQRKPILRRPLGEVGKDPFPQAQQGLTIGELAFEAIGQASEARADVADDLRLREVYLFHRRRRGADMDNLWSVMA